MLKWFNSLVSLYKEFKKDLLQVIFFDVDGGRTKDASFGGGSTGCRPQQYLLGSDGVDLGRRSSVWLTLKCPGGTASLWEELPDVDLEGFFYNKC